MISINLTKEDLQKVAEMVADKTIFCTKEVLTSDEAAKYMGISRSYLYKLTMKREIPHYKPMGKVVYFDRAELEEWLKRNKISTEEEIRMNAINYCIRNNIEKNGRNKRE